MIHLISCYDVFLTVLEEAVERFAPAWKVNEEKLDILREYCDAIDVLSERHDATAYDIEIDEEKMTVKITMVCPDVQFEYAKNDPLILLIERTVSYSFKASEDEDGLEVTFEFPSIWERAV